jgi:hypothetical protein
MFDLEFRLEDQGVFSIGLAHLLTRLSRRDPPATVLFITQESGKAGGRVKAWQT